MCRLHVGLSANERRERVIKKNKKKTGGVEEGTGGGGGRGGCFTERDREREREISDIYKSTNRRFIGHTLGEREREKSEREKEREIGHISETPENVRVILERVLLIDESRQSLIYF